MFSENKDCDLNFPDLSTATGVISASSKNHEIHIQFLWGLLDLNFSVGLSVDAPDEVGTAARGPLPIRYYDIFRLGR